MRGFLVYIDLFYYCILRVYVCSLKIEVFGVSFCLFDSFVLNFEISGIVKCLFDNGVLEFSRVK